MTRVLIVGGGVAGPVTAMGLQRAGIGAVVYEAHAPAADEEVGSYLTVATNGIDALRAIGADTPVLHAGFSTPTNLLYSSRGRRLGAVSNGGVLADGTSAHTIKRARLYQTLYQQAAAAASGSRSASGWASVRPSMEQVTPQPFARPVCLLDGDAVGHTRHVDVQRTSRH